MTTRGITDLLMVSAPINKRKASEVELSNPEPKQFKGPSIYQLEAATKIAQWWRRVRSSSKLAYFNPNHTKRYSDSFLLFLNDLHNIPKKFSYFRDRALLSDIKAGNWDSERFAQTDIHQIARNLFSDGKISWQQKATISDIIETAKYFGAYNAFPIFDAQNEFSPEATEHLLPFLVNHPPARNRKLTAFELIQLKNALLQMEPSEKYFFLFYEQRSDGEQSFPSPFSSLREYFVSLSFASVIKVLSLKRFFKRGQAKFSYHGIIKLSFSAEDIIGQFIYGSENWWLLVPRLAKQEINDIEKLSKNQIRPTFCPDSLYLHQYQPLEMIHGELCTYPDMVIHDDYHRKKAALLGKPVHNAIERVISLTREIFTYHWSCLIWALRDFDLDFVESHELGRMEDTVTRKFICALCTTHNVVELGSFDEHAQQRLKNVSIMMDEHFRPRQVALAFIIDLIKQPIQWEQLGISREAIGMLNGTLGNLFPVNKLIKIAEYLNQEHVFSEDMKENIIKFEEFIREEPFENDPQDWYPNQVRVLPAFQRLAQLDSREVEKYVPYRDNRQMFLGFVKKH